MSEKNTRRFRRKQYIVDAKFQVGMAVRIVGVIVGIALLYALALYVIPGGNGLEGMDAEEVADVLMRVNLVYVSLGTAILGVVAILLTHRVAGPVMVLTAAVKAMRKGDLTKRLTLRERDFLQGLSAELGGLRDRLVEQEQALADLESCLAEQDVDGARELLAKLRRGPVEEPAEEPAATA